MAAGRLRKQCRARYTIPLPPPPSRKRTGPFDSALASARATLRANGTPARGSGSRLRLRGLIARGPAGGGVRGVDLDVAAGEIVGLAGVEGNGQRELVLALAGLGGADAGTIAVDGVDVTRATVAARRARGLAFVP